MEARRLETLIAVARLGGLSKAADQLDIAPSTAALHLSELERELGVRLTERAGRGIRLTDGGRQLLEHAESVLTSVVPGYAAADRMEESNEWRHPVDLVGILERAFDTLPQALSEGRSRRGTWAGQEGLVRQRGEAKPR